MRAIYLLLILSGPTMLASARAAHAQAHAPTESAKAKNQAPAKGKAPTKPTKVSKPSIAQARKNPPPVIAAAQPALPAGAMAPITGIPLRDAPDGQSVGALTTRSTLEPMAHERGWVRVRAEGWVKEDEITPMDPSLVNLTAADLRADPDAAKGKLVRWNVQILAMQTADVLRKGLNPDEPYLLVRGPGSESALIYVAVPPSLLVSARTLAASAPLQVALVATVREGRSEPVGVPILDAQNLIRR